MQEEEALGKAYDARLMKRLLRYLWPYRRSAALALVAIIASAVLQLAQPYLTKLAIDHYIATSDVSGVNRIALIFLAVLIGGFALEYLETWTLQMMGQRIMYDLRLEIYEHLQRLGLRFYDRNPVGRLMTRVTTDVDVLNDLFTAGVIAVFGDVFTLLGIMVVMVALDWRLALLAFCVLPLIAWVTEWFRRHARESYRAVRVLVARINAFLQEHLTGMTTVQLFGQEERIFNRFDDINRRHRDAHIRSVFYYAVFYPVIEIIGALAAALIVWQGGSWVMEGTVTLGTLVAFLQYTRRFFQPISDLSEKFNLLQSAMASSERIFALLDEPEEESRRNVLRPAGEAAVAKPLHEPSSGGDPHHRGGPQIELDHVWFAYDGEEYVLRDVSFAVAAGERVGIVGATGAGKSTLINLLMRFYDVRRGRIVMDGTDIREMVREHLRSRFGLVLQDVHLFSGTIASNIRLGHDDIADDAIHRAARAVHADRFIERLPYGYDTPVAERGATLSVGQKQLLSFARALAFDPQVLLLDEATSSIDTETELLIREALAVLMKGRTTIAIAHRLSTIQDMDKILVLHKGELREAGTHQELLARRGIYYKLYQLQYKEQEVTAGVAESGD
ncbi:MAG: ATP-binding cassette domain-containing protein [Luteitalea sp.]|nr:ATP-binding cassette domain-containing protein [Luteitalea sp.]